jgi:hypothetical protein
MLFIHINVNLWLLFLPFLAIFIITSAWMKKIAKNFYTDVIVTRPFSIFSLEFPGSDNKLSSLILKMNADVKRSVRKHLLVDFVFMLGTYPGIAILCFIAARAVHSDSELGSNILQGWAFAQIIPWLCDITENAILLYKLKNPTLVNESRYSFFRIIVITKFFIALTAVTSTIFSMIYIWLIGGFSETITLIFSGLVILLIIIMIIIAIKNRIKRREHERELAAAIAKTM